MDSALKTMIANMPEKTGKTLEEWIKLLKAKSFVKHSEDVDAELKDWIKEAYENVG